MNMRADPVALRGPAASLAVLPSHAILIIDPNQRIRWANLAFGSLIGQPRADWTGQSTRALLRYLRHDSATVQALLKAVTSEQAIRLRSRLTGQSLRTGPQPGFQSEAHPCWLDIDLQPQHNHHGGFEGHIAILSDVTERVTHHEQAQSLLQALPVGVVTCDNQLAVLQANESAARILGLSLPELLRSSCPAVFADAVNEEGQPMLTHQRPAALTLRDGQPRHDVVCGRRAATGARRWLRISTVAQRNTAGVIDKVVLCFVDETEERHQRHILKLAIEAAQITPWHWNLSEDQAQFDTCAARAAGLRFEHQGKGLQTMPVWQAVHRDDAYRLRDELAKHESSGQSTLRAEFRLPSESGDWRWVLAAGAVSDRNPQGQITTLSGVLIDIDERKRAEAALQREATTDKLTGLPNRAVLGDRLEQATRAARRHGHCGGLLFIDLDHFKRINDVCGHVVGDHMLQAVCRRLQGHLRAEDTMARMGGDELMVLLPELGANTATALDNAEHVGRKLLAALQAPISVDGLEYTLGASMGCTVFPKSAQESAEDLVREADTAMYAAKASGRGMLKRYEHSMQRGVAERLALERDLRLALEQNQFDIHVQGKWALQVAEPNAVAGQPAMRKLQGAEVLLRWTHPQRGVVSPADFIPVAEESNLILAIGRWVMERACALQARWLAEGRPLPLAVNVSPRQFREPGFAEELLAITQRHGVSPAGLTLEITEGVLLDEGAAARLRELASHGFKFSIDDFGTGYSSLMYLKQLPVHELKIDRAFVRDLTTDPEDAAIVLAMLAIAKSFRIDVVAEGVETSEQADFLASHGCALMQGYLFGRPLPLATFDACPERAGAVAS